MKFQVVAEDIPPDGTLSAEFPFLNGHENALPDGRRHSPFELISKSTSEDYLVAFSEIAPGVVTLYNVSRIETSGILRDVEMLEYGDPLCCDRAVLRWGGVEIGGSWLLFFLSDLINF